MCLLLFFKLLSIFISDKKLNYKCLIIVYIETKKSSNWVDNKWDLPYLFFSAWWLLGKLLSYSLFKPML
ncbi:hypothetical protein BLL41_14415 [Bacillus sp. FMQ74]|nr:hypothetical protein BLL41_14415 [Bacillus sp. FMQ74]